MKNIVFVFVLMVLCMAITCTSAQPLPPSRHILSYEEFIEGNAYAGEYISINAKIYDIERSKDLDKYSIELMSLKGEKGVSETKWVSVLVDHELRIEIKDGNIFTVDKDFGVPLVKEDNVVIIANASWFKGMRRPMEIGSGTIILLLTKDQYENRKDIIHTDHHTIIHKAPFDVIAVGDYDLSFLDNNYELLDRDDDGLISPIDPYPNEYDHDKDGLSDYEEMVVYKTSSLTKDTDRDGLDDYEEVNKGTDGYITNPLTPDTDGDTLSDKEEVTRGEDGWITDPNNPDTDGDGIRDDKDPDPAPIDTDGDGLSDIEELEIGTNIKNADTDGDGLPDGKEVRGVYGYKTDPLKEDTDGDGLNDKIEIDDIFEICDREYHFNFDPTKYDTDGDGISDKDEVKLKEEEELEKIEQEKEKEERAEIEKMTNIGAFFVSLCIAVFLGKRLFEMGLIKNEIKIERKLFKKR